MSGPVVQVTQGRIKGFVAKNVEGGEYHAFCGIPYAEPPIGDLRFKDPRPPKAWTGTRDVGNMSTKCCQYDPMTQTISGSEDCLYLKVATKKLNGKQPVMVFIHGGGFVAGSPDSDIFGPDYLVRHDIVFVGIAYRLGSFGFLNLDLPDASGNQGLKDQIAALKWIKENIHVFGGDPENITIFGHSAGAACVHFLTLTPLTRGLFHKAIVQSGSFTNPWAISENPVKVGLETAAILGKRTKDPTEALEFLKTVPVVDLLEVQKLQKRRDMDYEMVCDFAPSIDSKSIEPLILELPAKMAKRGINVPLIVGFVSEEGLVGYLGPSYETFVHSYDVNFTNCLEYDLKISELDKIAKDVRKFYFGNDAITMKNIKELIQCKGNIMFANGVEQIVDKQMTKSTPTYFYRFSYRPSYRVFRSLLQFEIDATCHADEICTLFYSKIFMEGTHKPESKDRLIMERMTLMWTNFAKTGNPTPELDDKITCKWEPITQDKKNCMEINDDLTLGSNPCEDDWYFWKHLRVYDNL